VRRMVAAALDDCRAGARRYDLGLLGRIEAGPGVAGAV